MGQWVTVVFVSRPNLLQTWPWLYSFEASWRANSEYLRIFSFRLNPTEFQRILWISDFRKVSKIDNFVHFWHFPLSFVLNKPEWVVLAQSKRFFQTVTNVFIILASQQAEMQENVYHNQYNDTNYMDHQNVDYDVPIGEENIDPVVDHKPKPRPQKVFKPRNRKPRRKATVPSTCEFFPKCWAPPPKLQYPINPCKLELIKPYILNQKSRTFIENSQSYRFSKLFENLKVTKCAITRWDFV